MKISLEHNIQGDLESVPFLVRVEIVTATVDAGSTFLIPITIQYKGLEKSFSANLCGFELSSSRPEALVGQINQFLPRLISLARLPSYMFIARRAGRKYPVYTLGSEVYATAPGSPVFRHVELAKVREYLTDYLHAAGILGEKGLDDKLHVRGVNMHTLELKRPICYLKKRVPGETDFWAPVFDSGEGHIYTYAADERREVPTIAGAEILFLRQMVANALITDKRLTDAYDLRTDRILPEYWERLKPSLIPQPSITVQGMTLPVFSNNGSLIALEERPDEDRFSLFFGKQETDLQARVEADFARRGIAVS
jgi:hypothetical protein